MYIYNKLGGIYTQEMCVIRVKGWCADMKVSYKKMWVLCAEKEMSKVELRRRAGLSSATFTKLRKNQEVTIAVMLKLADVLDCNAGDMMDFIKDDIVVEHEPEE